MVVIIGLMFAVGTNRAGVEIVLTIGSDLAVVNATTHYLDAPAGLWGNRTFVPLRFVSEILGHGVHWEQHTGTITITR